MRHLVRRRHRWWLAAAATRCSALTAIRPRRGTVRLHAAPVTPRVDAAEDSDDAKPHYPLAPPPVLDGATHPAFAVDAPIQRRRPFGIPLIGRYVSYLEELWRADTVVKAHDDVEEVGQTTLGTRVATGVALGFIFSAWVFSTPSLFAAGHALQAIAAGLEYFRVAIIQGAAPARKIACTTTCVLMAVACHFPTMHELVFPLATTWMMVWLLLARRACSTIQDISTTLMGLVYTAYLPSWWVRLRCAPNWSNVAGKTFWFAPQLTHRGAQHVWWTCLSIACADIGAYFGGKKFGRHSLDKVGLGAAAKASPNKTTEGAVSGLVSAGLCSYIGAYALRWERPVLGFVYGAGVATIALVGDLTASMLKRDADVKDFGHLFPGHGGILDRLDSFFFVAPLAFGVLPRLAPAGPWVA
jgi:phosphatidate cytidylyltransferase